MPNSVTCNVLVGGLVGFGEIEKAMDVLNDMLVWGFSPTSTTIKILLDTSSKSRRGDVILQMHERLVDMGVRLNQAYYNSLITILCRLGMTRKATSVLEDMRGRGIMMDTITYNALIRGYWVSSHINKALATYTQMINEGVSPNTATYNILLGIFLGTGSTKEVDDLFGEMKKRGLKPDASTYDTLISGHAKIGNKKESIQIYCEMITKGYVPKTSTYNVLIGDFAKEGKMHQARELLKEMQARGRNPNSSTYDILIGGWCELSNEPELDRTLILSYRAEAKKLFMEMNEKGFVPCESTQTCFSSTFARPGKKADAQRLLQEFYKSNDI